jgi:hypothetical protein
MMVDMKENSLLTLMRGGSKKERKVILDINVLQDVMKKDS